MSKRKNLLHLVVFKMNLCISKYPDVSNSDSNEGSTLVNVIEHLVSTVDILSLVNQTIIYNLNQFALEMNATCAFLKMGYFQQ